MEVRKITDPRSTHFGHEGPVYQVMTTRVGTFVRWWTGNRVIQAPIDWTEITPSEEKIK